MEPEFLALYERCRTETMTSIERMHALWSALRYVVHNRIDGDIVECGVWRGGSMMLSALALGAASGSTTPSPACPSRPTLTCRRCRAFERAMFLPKHRAPKPIRSGPSP